MNLKHTLLTIVAAAALAAAGVYAVCQTPWFSQTFSGLEEGSAFTGREGGATGGAWLAMPTNVATVATVGGRKCIDVNTGHSELDFIQFCASNALSRSVRVDFAISTDPLVKPPLLGEGDWGALCLLSTNQVGVRVFGGYAKDGWKELYGRGLAEHRVEWLDCRAVFEYATNDLGQVSSAHVTYYAMTSGSDYVPLVCADGSSRFEVETNVVDAIAFSGMGFVGDFSGFGLEAKTPRVCVWKGPSGSDIRWENPENWSGNRVPGDGDLAQVEGGKSIAYGKYTFELLSRSSLSIVSNASVRIGPYGDTAGNVAIFCADGDYTSLGTVYVDAASTLQACGTYAGVEMSFGSTLDLDASVGLTVANRRFFLDGVTLDISKMPDGANTKEGVPAISAPHGSGGLPAKLKATAGWTVAWHDRLDGGADLWLVNGGYSGALAVWNGEVNSDLTNRKNWSRDPGAAVAAQMCDGHAEMSGSNPLSFQFARWFDIGHTGKSEVVLHKGNFSVLGNADKGGAVVVGSDGGTGLLDLVGGSVKPYDYLWNYALTLALGVNSTGTVTVCGGTVDAAGGSVSVGADGPADMVLEKGCVSVGGSFGVGYEGTLDMSGGVLAVSNSLYIGRAARTESYDVRMVVSEGAVSNLAAGAIWVGSYGNVGSKAALSLTGGEIYATNRFVCGGYRSAQVDVAGGTLVAPEICVGLDLVDEADFASFNLLSGRVVTAGFTSGSNGVRKVALAGGELVATAANDDFFKGLESVRLDGEMVFANQDDIAVKSALIGPGDFVKTGYGTNTISGFAAWNGRTAVEEGVLDMDGCLISGELHVEPGASAVRAKYDEIDTLMAFLSEKDWCSWKSGMSSTGPYVYVDFSLTNGATAVSTDGDGVVKGAIGFVVDKVSGEDVFRGRTVLGWTELFFQENDGEAVKSGAKYDLRMLFDFRTVGSCAKPYVMYYAKRGNAYERLVDADGVSAFPAAGDAMSIESFSGATMTAGRQLNLASGREFHWIGPDGGKWNDAANWSGPDGGSVSDYPKADSIAFIEKPVLVTFPEESARTALLYVNADVRLSGGYSFSVSNAIAGVGTLTLSNATLHAIGYDVLVAVPVVVQDGTVNRLLSTPSSCAFVLDGPLRGTGEIIFSALNRRPMGGAVLAGDNSDFGGLVKIFPWASDRDHQQLDMPSIATPQSSSANAAWEINVERNYPKALKPGVDFFGVPNATYRFGSLKANFYYTNDYDAYWTKDGVTLEVGARDEDGYALGTCAGADGVIDWIAPTATFTNAVRGLSALRLSGGGKLVVADDGAVPSDAITFVDKGGELVCTVNTNLAPLVVHSTAPVVFNGGDRWREWSGAPDASNVGGFVKRGSGTLKWWSVPSFRIDVTVEEGTLIVPFGTRLGRISVSHGAALVVDCSDAERNSLVFSSDAADCRMRDPELRFWNVPEDYAIDITYGDGNAIVASNGGAQFDWTGDAGDCLWATPSNWWLHAEKTVPERPPRNLDSVWYDASYTTCLDRPAAAMKVRGFGDLSLVGSHALDVLLQFELDGLLDLSPNPMSADSSSADYYGATTNVLGVSSVAAFSASTIRGEGFVSVGGKDLVLSPWGAATNRFVGTLCAGCLVKKGDAVFEFIGDGAFPHGVRVEQGTLRLGSYRDIDGIRMDFDASDEESLEPKDGKPVESWASTLGTSVFTYADGQKAVPTKDFFGGRRAVMFRPSEQGKAYSRYDLSPANQPDDTSASLFVVYAPDRFDSGYLYAQSDDSTRSLYRAKEGGPWYCPKAEFGKNGIFSGVDYGSDPTTKGVPALTFWSDTPLVAGSKESLGTAGTTNGFRGAVGEIVAFSRTLTHVERDVVSRALMDKWGVPGCAEFAPVHADTPVTMSAGATLDLGGQTLTVGSFTGAGTVTNGVLKTADRMIAQSGGALNVPAVEGMTYVASSAGQKLVIRDASGVAVKIVLPKGWFSAGNTGRCAIFCESTRIEWDIWRKDVRPFSEGNGWWSITGGGFAIRLK